MTSRIHSIRGKLTGIIMMTSTIAVLLACLGFVIADLFDLQHRLAGDLSTLAQVVGSNSTAALAFGDRAAATEVLSALRAKPSIIAACIYTQAGEQFGVYAPDRSIAIPRTPNADGIHESDQGLELIYPIRLDGERIGTLYIASDRRERDALMKQYGLIALAIVLVSLLITFVLSSKLQGRISNPIVELARVTGVVSRDKNFSVRATHPRSIGSDEISNLVAGFNGMLAEIEQRDHRLLLHQTHLEETVALRTGELTRANENLLTARDVAEKVAEINAQLARESALILNSATDGIFGVGLDMKPSFLNPAASRLLGRTLGDFGSRSAHELIHHSPIAADARGEADCPLGQALLRGEPMAVAEDTFWKADGSSFPVEFSATPMVDEDGNKMGTVVVFRDVTERRAIDRMKSEFVSTVSHELRTPLTSIRGALGLLSSGLLGSIEEKGQRMLEIAVSNTDRLVRLINDILDLERIESGRVELSLGAADADSIMVQSLEGVQAMADQAGVRLVVSGRSVSGTATLWADHDRIIQTLTNLLGNAIKFSPAATTVTLSAVTDGAWVVFSVADQGRGVPEEKLETIFERFKQVDASDSRDKGGSGLGLAICRSIVNAHGGRIWASVNEPAGTRFQFTIPLAAPSILAGPATGPLSSMERGCSVPPAELAGGGPSILVFENDADLVNVMTAALQRHGIRTFHSALGGNAVQLCRNLRPSLIVLDLALSDVSGFTVIKALREESDLGRIPVLVYSALDVASAERLRLHLGPTRFLTKSRSSLTDFENHVLALLADAVHPATAA